MRKEIKGLGWELRDLPQNIGAANGTAVHAAAANALTTKKDTGELGQVDDAIEVGVESLKKQAGEVEIAWDQTTPEMSVAQQQVIRQTRLYHDKVAPGIKPLAVEEALRAEIEDGFVLSGHVDVTEEFDLHDLKTGEESASQSGTIRRLRSSPSVSRRQRQQADRRLHPPRVGPLTAAGP